ncbi:unnamed protein product [Spirodela intermedia]|uniref:Uncharacterized protein n=1 Tax=Spirodela intermedia TaxID=51605 RepID=A0A7I8KNY8_SPIIN|nr:unnamed protein product [Spirodela intermedia]
MPEDAEEEGNGREGERERGREEALKEEGSTSLFTGMKPSNWTAWTIFPSRSASFTMALLQDLQDALDDFAYSAFHGFAGVPISPPPLRELLPLHSQTLERSLLSRSVRRNTLGAITWRK